MKFHYKAAISALMLCGLTGCLVGRLTGGGTYSGTDLTDPDAHHAVSAQVSFQDVSAAICNYQDGQTLPDTIKGSFKYRETSPNKRSYTCEVDVEPLVPGFSAEVPSQFYGSGQFSYNIIVGNVTRYAGNWGESPPVKCAVVAGKSQFPGVTPQNGRIPVNIALHFYLVDGTVGAADLFAAALVDDGTNDDELEKIEWILRAKGSLETGNLQYHLANAQGLCSSIASN